MLHVCVFFPPVATRNPEFEVRAFRRELDGQDELLLDLLPFDEEGSDDHIPDLGHIVSEGPFSRRKVEVKIVGEFVGVMVCGEMLGETDSFTLVNWRAGCGNNVLSSPANTYSPSFCFIDHETVATSICSTTPSRHARSESQAMTRSTRVVSESSTCPFPNARLSSSRRTLERQ
ncbi:hypothetical protein EI94DRAFT_199237 [Lactarius quietus]|nr:hypothetical protein EI94DRAFT_199237 [Lactarius quietus]